MPAPVRYLIGRSTDILKLEAGEGIAFERDGDTLRVLRDPNVVVYGSMSLYSLGAGPITVVVGATDTFYQIGATLSPGILDQVVFQNDNELRVLVAGIYAVTWSLAVETPAANQEIEGAVMVDGVAHTGTAAHAGVLSANRPVTIGGCGLLDLAAEAVVSLAVLNHVATQDITISHLTCLLQRVG